MAPICGEGTHLFFFGALISLCWGTVPQVVSYELFLFILFNKIFDSKCTRIISFCIIIKFTGSKSNYCLAKKACMQLIKYMSDINWMQIVIKKEEIDALW